MRNQIEFLLGDEAVSITGIAPELTVLEWLRRNGRVGTKEGCAEGDCGACTVVVAERDGEGLRYRAVNSCIQPMVSLDGRQLITVEDLAEPGRSDTPVLHPVQQAMVDHHGSQCGFCTPGFVMSMFAMAHQPELRGRGGQERQAINEALAGNLCRCTGYAPIVRAGRELLTAGGGDRFDRERDRTLEALAALSPPECLRLSRGRRQMLVPRSLEELLSLLAQYPDAVPVAGATDVGLWLTKDLKRFETMIYVGDVSELLEIETGAEFIEIGAAVTYSDAMPVLTEHFPDMRTMLSRLGGLQVRNAGTIGGNIANGSPIGDMPPPLIALRARLVLTSRDSSHENKTREIELEDFFLEYGRQDLEPGECVHKVRIPVPPADQQFRTYKLSKRFDQDISAVLGAYAMRLDGEEVADIRIAYGGMAGVPSRARACEQALVGKPWSDAAVDAACEAMRDDFTPLSDWRASAEYRMLAAQNLLRRFYLETTGQVDGPGRWAKPVNRCDE